MLPRLISRGFIEATGRSITDESNQPVGCGFRNQTSSAGLPEVVGRGPAVTPQAGRLGTFSLGDGAARAFSPRIAGKVLTFRTRA
jgi:hypothetical protein